MTFVAVIAGARPNFMKVDPLLRAFDQARIRSSLVHTGQHYDDSMSAVFFRELDIREPDTHLGVGSGTHAAQTAAVMIAYEQYCLANQPSWTVVVGDVNSTVACSLVAAKLGIRVCHVEAGLRSGDWTMPEEVNRVVTDRLADLLLTPSPDADENLRKEGIPESKIHCVGNVMIDTLFRLLPVAQSAPTLGKLGLLPGKFALCTLHRPSNVDSLESLTAIMNALAEISGQVPVLFPAHPRTQRQITEFGLDCVLQRFSGLRIIDPVGYIDCLALSSQAALVLTDSGGLQEETTALGVPCLTLRENTERPITVSQGTNRVVGTNPTNIIAATWEILKQGNQPRRCPELWDGKSAERCAQIIKSHLS